MQQPPSGWVQFDDPLAAPPARQGPAPGASGPPQPRSDDLRFSAEFAFDVRLPAASSAGSAPNAAASPSTAAKASFGDTFDFGSAGGPALPAAPPSSGGSGAPATATKSPPPSTGSCAATAAAEGRPMSTAEKLADILRSDRKRAKGIIAHKMAVLTKWKDLGRELNATNHTLKERIAAAREENVRLKKELADLLQANAAEKDELLRFHAQHIYTNFDADLAMLRDPDDWGNVLSNAEDIAFHSVSVNQEIENVLQSVRDSNASSLLMDVGNLAAAVGALARTAKGFAHGVEDEQVRQSIVAAASDVMCADAFRVVIDNPSDFAAATNLAKAIRAKVGALRVILDSYLASMRDAQQSSGKGDVGVDEDASIDADTYAERELKAAAARIQAAADALRRSKAAPKAPSFDASGIEVCDSLLDAAGILTGVTGELMILAAAAQRERTQLEASQPQPASRDDVTSGKYRKNTLWVNGLVSAAQAVAARIVSMVACANDVVAGTRSWEYVLGTSDDVQMAAVQLITASRAKLPITSVNKSNLEACKRKLSQAARGLVEATESFRAMQTPKADRVTTSEPQVGGAIRAQARIHQERNDMEALKLRIQEEEKVLQRLLSEAGGTVGEPDDDFVAVAVTKEDKDRTILAMAATARELQAKLAAGLKKGT